MHIRKDYDSATTIHVATIANGGITVSQVLGEIHVDIPASVTAGFTKDGVYDLEIYTSGGIVYKVVKGRFRLNPEVTK